MVFINTELLKRWSKARHVKICRENIQKDWKLAHTILEIQVENGAFEAAAAIAEEVMHFDDGGDMGSNREVAHLSSPAISFLAF